MIDHLLRSDGYDILVVGGHEYELGEFFRFLPHEPRGRVAGTFSADPVATPVAEIRSSAEGVMRHEQDQRLVAHFLELTSVGGLAAVGPEDCLWPAACPPSTRCCYATARPWSGRSVTVPLAGGLRGHLRGLREAHPVRPGRPGRTRGGRHRDRRLGQADRVGPHARPVPDGSAASVPASTARGRAAEGRRQPVIEYRCAGRRAQARRGGADPLPGDGRRAAAPGWPSPGTSRSARPRPPG